MQFLVLVSALLSTGAVAQLSSVVNKACNTRYSVSPTTRIRTTTYRASITRTVGRTLVVSNVATVDHILQTCTLMRNASLQINPVTTVTSAPSTFFTTSTSTALATVTAASSTDTFTAFQTITQTQTFTNTQSFTTATTVLSTTLVAGITRTIAAPSGFTALADSPGFSAKKRSPLLERREPHVSRDTKARYHLPALPEAGKALNARQNGDSGAQFPVGVQCTSRTTFFATSTTTSTAVGTGGASTVTIVAPNVISTVTVSTTGTTTVRSPPPLLSSTLLLTSISDCSSRCYHFRDRVDLCLRHHHDNLYLCHHPVCYHHYSCTSCHAVRSVPEQQPDQLGLWWQPDRNTYLQRRLSPPVCQRHRHHRNWLLQRLRHHWQLRWLRPVSSYRWQHLLLHRHRWPL